MNGPFSMPIHVRIKSYNRPRHLSNLLMDLHRQATQFDIALDVVVFDDASTVPMTAPRAIVDEAGWRWVAAEDNHGKQGAWAWHNQMYDSLRDVTEQAFIYFFDDDMRLCDQFFGTSLTMWGRVNDPDKATLHLMVDSSRQNASCWTGVQPRKLDRHLRRTQWVDGSFLCQRRTLDALKFSLNEIGADRWKTHPERSTGVGQQISHRLHDLGLGLYQTCLSLVVHASSESYYNPKERKATPLQTVNFIDGVAACKRLMRAEDIECSLATIPSRVQTLKQVTELLYDQVDRLRVYLNGYDEVPAFLDRPRITAVLSQKAMGDIGDRGKFYWCEEASGYQLTVDDDIHYPANYVDRIVAGLERYNLRAVVGVHGVVFKNLEFEQVESYYKSRTVTHFSLKLDRDMAAHLVGTGTLGYHPSSLQLKLRDFPAANMADIWVGRQTQRQKVPVVTISRAVGWMRPLPTEGSIYDDASRNDQTQTGATKAAWPWVLHKMSQSRGHHHELCSAGGDPHGCRCRTWQRSGYDAAKSVRRYVSGMRKTTMRTTGQTTLRDVETVHRSVVCPTCGAQPDMACDKGSRICGSPLSHAARRVAAVAAKNKGKILQRKPGDTGPIIIATVGFDVKYAEEKDHDDNAR
jgi:hypothetical protein